AGQLTISTSVQRSLLVLRWTGHSKAHHPTISSLPHHLPSLLIISITRRGTNPSRRFHNLSILSTNAIANFGSSGSNHFSLLALTLAALSTDSCPANENICDFNITFAPP